MKVLFTLLCAAFLLSPPVLSAKTPRIVGGQPAPAGEFPWMVAVLDKHTSDNWVAQFAGGSLIHPRWVLTAAHIVIGQKAADMQVIVGATNLNAAGLQRLNVLEIVRHPGYVDTGFDFDVALLLLENPVTNVTPVEILSNPGLAGTDVVATTMGWGSLSNADNDFGTAILQSVELPIVDQDLANTASWHNGALTANMLAAGYAAGGKDSCSGDSGGPLVIRGPQNQWLQAGVVSWGEECGLPMKPGVYSRVSRYRQWIQTYVWPDFYAWESSHNITSDDNPDRDGDGATQWQEYAFRSNPNVPFDAPALFVAGRFVDAGHTYPTLTLRRPAGGGNLAWSLQHSTNLTTWTPLSAVTQRVGDPVAVPGDATSEDITWRGLDGTSASFLRALASPGTEYYNSRRPLAFPGGVTHALHAGDTLTGGFRTRDYLLSDLPVGQNLTLTLRSSAFNAVLHLVNADTGAIITTSNSNTGGGNDEKLTLTPAAGTRYAARVTTQVAGGTGEFILCVFRLKTGIPTIGGSQTLSGSLLSTDPVDPFFPDGTYYYDDYLFTSATGAPITLYQTSSTFAPDMAIINAETGERLFTASGEQSDVTYSRSAMHTFIPRTGVAYYFRASSYDELETGNYTIRTAAANTISVPASRSGAFTATDGLDTSWLPDYAILADDYVLTGLTTGIPRTISATSATVDMVIELFDAETGVSLEYDDDGDPEIVFTPITGHSYLVRVTGYNELETGNYTVSVQ